MGAAAATAPTIGRHAKTRAADIQAWMVENLEDALELDPGELDVDEPFDAYGLDSSEAVSFMSALEDWLGRELPPNLVYQYPTIAALARHLAGDEPGPAA